MDSHRAPGYHPASSATVRFARSRPGADYGVLRNLEIKGGFYYGIMFFTSWENYGAMADRVALGAGPRHWLVQNVR